MANALLLSDLKSSDLREIQTLLATLGLYPESAIDGIFGRLTAAGWQQFKEQNYLGRVEEIGEASWELLRERAEKIKAIAATSPPCLRLTKTERSDRNGLTILILEYLKGGKSEGAVECVSGVRGRQRFRTGADSKAGSLEPLPEGKWSIGDIQWFAGKDNYKGQGFGQALGPVKIPLYYIAPGTTSRSEILIHLDWNGKTSPGTAGCLAPLTVSGMQQIVKWLRESNSRHLFVDWGLGTCPSIW